MDNKKLENKAENKVKQTKSKEKDIYICTDKYPCLPEGFEIPIADENLAKEFIKKGYIKKA